MATEVYVVTDERGTFYASYTDRTVAEQVRADLQRAHPQRQIRVAYPSAHRLTPPTGPSKPIPPRW